MLIPPHVHDAADQVTYVIEGEVGIRLGLEGLILEQSVPATRHAVPEPGDVPPPDLHHMREVALRYGCELLA